MEYLNSALGCAFGHPYFRIPKRDPANARPRYNAASFFVSFRNDRRFKLPVIGAEGFTQATHIVEGIDCNTGEAWSDHNPLAEATNARAFLATLTSAT